MNAKRKHIPVRLSGLADGHHELNCSVDPADIDLPAEFNEAVSVTVDLDTSHNQSALHIQVDTTAEYPCDRCLEPVRLPVLTNFVLVYSHDNSEQSPDENEIRRIDMTDPIIDLAEDVRDAAVVCIPMRRICGEDSDGNSLCPSPIPDVLNADKQKREDPRWDRLKTLNLDQ